MTPRVEKKRYYWVEMSTDSASAISSACETFADLMVGKLNNMEAIVAAAYERRTGEQINEAAMEQIRNALKTIQYIGWDSTYGNPVNVHGCSKVTDSLYDVIDVLNYQMGQDQIEPFVGSRYPMHWNDDMPLCRIVRTTLSSYKRIKQLVIFPSDKK